MLILLKKELYEIIRDKRSIISALLYSIMGPLLLLMIFDNLIRQERNEEKLLINLYATSENLHNQLLQVNEYLTFKKAKTKIITKADFSDWSDKHAVVELSNKKLASGKERLLINVYINPSEDKLYKNGQNVIDLIKQYQGSQKFVESLKHGVIQIIQPFDISVHKTNNIDPRGRNLLLILLTFILLAPFFSSLNVANDTTAGERERGTLISLLTQPIDTLSIAISKWLGASMMGICGTLITLALTAWLTEKLPLYEIGIYLNIGKIDWILAGIILIPYACFAAALQMWVALYAKNYKEGQNYLMLLSFAPMMLIFAKQFSVIDFQQTWLPLIGHESLIDHLFSGQNISLPEIALPAFSSLAITAALILMIKQKLQSETILSET